jgi:hypothetical protein
MESFNIGLDSWIIQDGNYPDFQVGQEADFALEFYPLLFKPSDKQTKSFRHLNNCNYQICGQVIYQTRNVWVLDFGLLAYEQAKPPRYATKDAWVEGEIDLGIDPFFYFEELYGLPGMPALTNRFRIEQILLETTPWFISKDDGGRTVLERVKLKESFKEVYETDAWNDDNGSACYILKCLLLKSCMNQKRMR